MKIKHNLLTRILEGSLLLQKIYNMSHNKSKKYNRYSTDMKARNQTHKTVIHTKPKVGGL